MALTNQELIRRALAHLSIGQQSPSVWLDSEDLAAPEIEYAMHNLATKVWKDPRRKGLLSQDYSVTLTNGVGTILTATGTITSEADILYESVADGKVRDTANDVLLAFIPQVAQFEGHLQLGLYYYTLRNQRIYTRSATSGIYGNDQYDVIGPLTITAQYIPTVSSIPVELEDEAVITLAELMAKKFEAE